MAKWLPGHGCRYREGAGTDKGVATGPKELECAGASRRCTLQQTDTAHRSCHRRGNEGIDASTLLHGDDPTPKGTAGAPEPERRAAPRLSRWGGSRSDADHRLRHYSAAG